MIVSFQELAVSWENREFNFLARTSNRKYFFSSTARAQRGADEKEPRSPRGTDFFPSGNSDVF